MSSNTAARDARPWFQRSPRATIAVAALLYLAIFALRMATGRSSDATSMLFVLPMALLAVTFGLRAGLAGGLVAVGLIATWVLTKHVNLSATGWTTRIVPMILLGILLGQATDRLRKSEAERARLDEATRWHRQAVEINDSIVQGLAVAKWSLEGGDLNVALRVVTETLDEAHVMVSQLLRDAGLEPGGANAAASMAALSGLSHPAESNPVSR